MKRPKRPKAGDRLMCTYNGTLFEPFTLYRIYRVVEHFPSYGTEIECDLSDGDPWRVTLTFRKTSWIISYGNDVAVAFVEVS